MLFKNRYWDDTDTGKVAVLSVRWPLVYKHTVDCVLSCVRASWEPSVSEGSDSYFKVKCRAKAEGKSVLAVKDFCKVNDF